MRKRFLGLVAGVLLVISGANAQVVQQSGSWSPGRMPMYSGPSGSAPVVIDAGTAAGGVFGKNPSELGITSRDPKGVYPSANSGAGQDFAHFCMYDAPTTNATGYHYLCLDPNATGAGLIAYGAAGGANQLPFYFLLNGAQYQIPAISGSIAYGVDVRTFGAQCGGGTSHDDTAGINAAIATGAPTVFVPLGCYIAGTVTLGQGQTIRGYGEWTGAAKQDNNYLSIANLVMGPSGTVVSGSSATLLTTTTNSSLQNLTIVASNYVAPTTVRQAYTSARAFQGTAITCQTPDFAVKNTLIVGFQTAILGTAINANVACSRLSADNVQGDDTNGVIFQANGNGNTASGDIPRLTNINFSPFISFATNCNCQFQALSIASITNLGGQFEINLSSAPSTPLVEGDIVQFGPTLGMPTLYSSEPGSGWPIHVIDPTHFTLTGSTFAGTYSVAPYAYFSAIWRGGKGIGITNASTSFQASNIFIQSFQTAYSLGTGSAFFNCADCQSEYNPGTTAPPQSIGIDFEGNTGRNSFIGGYIVAGTAVKVNTSDNYPQFLSGFNSLAALYRIVEMDSGYAEIVGGSLFPLNYVADFQASVYLGSGNLCLRQPNLANVAYTGTLSNLSCVTQGSIFSTGGALFGQTPAPGAITQVTASNLSSSASTFAQFLAQTSAGYISMQQSQGSASSVLYSSPGNTGGMLIQAAAGDAVLQAAAGNVTLLPKSGGFIKAVNLPTSCSGAPTGAIWSNSGALGVCP